MSLFSGASSSLQYQNDKSDKSSQKRHYLQEYADKENVEQQSKILALRNASKASCQERKGPDDGNERPQRARALQEIELGNRVQAASDTRAFVKSRFSIYNDYGNAGKRPAEKHADGQIHDDLDTDKRAKEAHLARKKAPRVLHDILSTEAAYNINYMNEFLTYQMEMHDKRAIPASSLSAGINAEQRRLIVKYLIRSVAYRKYPSFISYQAVKIFDVYVAKVVISVDELQTAALAALWIALKKDMITDDIPSASQLLNEFAGKLYQGNVKPLVKCEKSILMALNFEISFADPFSIYALLIATIAQARDIETTHMQKLYYCGSYLIDLSSLVYDEKSHVSAVCLAVTCAEISLCLYYTSDEELDDPQWVVWQNQIFTYNPVIHHIYNTRLCYQYASAVRSQLLQKVMHSKDNQTDFHIVYKKHNTKRYGPISTFITAKVSALYLKRICNSKYEAEPINFL